MIWVKVTILVSVHSPELKTGRDDGKVLELSCRFLFWFPIMFGLYVTAPCLALSYLPLSLPPTNCTLPIVLFFLYKFSSHTHSLSLFQFLFKWERHTTFMFFRRWPRLVLIKLPVHFPVGSSWTQFIIHLTTSSLSSYCRGGRNFSLLF